MQLYTGIEIEFIDLIPILLILPGLQLYILMELFTCKWVCYYCGGYFINLYGSLCREL